MLFAHSLFMIWIHILTIMRNTNVKKDFKVTEEHLQHAEILWDYLLMKQRLEKSDAIIVFGNCDIRTAEYASSLYLQGWADWLVFAGCRGDSTPESWYTEAETFKRMALEMNVPESSIILEKESRNTGQNTALCYTAMKNHGIDSNKIIIAQMPFMERRVYATVMKQWPGNKQNLRVIVKSPPIKLVDYPTLEVGTLPEVISKAVGCLQRVIEYPALGFHIHQEVPENVSSAYNELVQVEQYGTHLFGKKNN